MVGMSTGRCFPGALASQTCGLLSDLFDSSILAFKINVSRICQCCKNKLKYCEVAWLDPGMKHSILRI